jgi:hypothetical protein
MIIDELSGKKTVEDADPDNLLEVHAAAFIRRFDREYAFPLEQAMKAAATRDAVALMILEGTLKYDPATGTLRKPRTH